MLLLTLEDPKARVGSGGATVNGLLVVAEHLSAKAGFEVFYPGVFKLLIKRMIIFIGFNSFSDNKRHSKSVCG